MTKKVLLLLFLCAVATCLPALADDDRLLPRLNDIYWFDQPQQVAAPEGEQSAYFKPKDAGQGAHPQKHPMIAIVIDDMGVDMKRSARAVHNLPAAVTLSYLPYSRKIVAQTEEAKTLGHQLLVHVPMEPDRATADPGPGALLTTLPPDELRARIKKDLKSFSGYAGINNHMGSKFTQSSQDMTLVMDALKEQEGVFFLDSKTDPASVGEATARAQGIPTTHRDVFLDHVETEKFTQWALNHTEMIAARNGSVVAIGHPKDLTLGALEKWIPTLEKKGFRLVPLSEVVKYRESRYHAPPVAVAAPKHEKAAVPAVAPAEGDGGKTEQPASVEE